MRKSLLVFFWMVVLIPGVKAQDGLPRFRHFGLKEGLSTSSVTSICQDKEGKIWVGTHDGLNCFYGSFFKTYYQDRENPYGLNQSAISDLLCDKNGRLWIATYGGGINCLDPVTHQFLPIPKELQSQSWRQVNCLAEDKQGKIWIGYYEGLLIFNPANGQVKTIDRIPGTQTVFSVLRIAFDPEGTAFLATPFDGMFALTDNDLLLSVPHSEFQREPNGTGFFYHLYSQSRGVLACTQSGPMRFWYKNRSLFWEKAADLPDQEFVACLKDFKGRLWLPLASSGLLLLDGDRKPLPIGLPYKGKFPGGRINEVFQDKWGGIWIGSTTGLSYSHPQLSKFSSWSFDEKSKEEGLQIVWSIFTENDLHFYIGSESGLYLFNASTFESQRIPFSDGRTNKKAYSFLKTRSRRILAGTSQGIFEIQQGQGQPVAERIFGNVDGVISAMVELADGDLLIGTYDERGIYRLDPSGRVKEHFLLKNSAQSDRLMNNSINCFELTREGKVWIGTDNGFGLFDPETNRFDNSIWDLWPKNRKFSSLIYGLADAGDQLWIGTFGSGILIFDKQKRSFRHIGMKEGMPNESVYQLVRQKDKVWASTNKGLCLIGPGTADIRVFTEGDGLQSNEFNHFASFLNPVSGKLYFGGLQGFDEVSGFSPPENFNLPKVVISSARLLKGNEVLPLPLDGKPWKFDYHEQNLEIEFAALNYLMPEKNQFAYILSSTSRKESSRIPLPGKDKISLANLEPGEYTLQLFAANNEGTWSVKPLIQKILIEPPFWKTLWFRITVFLVVALVLLLIFRLYLKARLRDQTLEFERKEAVRIERNRISAEMHDDLGSGLTSIKMFCELLKLKTGKEPVPELQKIASRSDQLVESLNTIVWALNDRNDQIKPMVAYLRSYARNQFEERGLELKMEVYVDESVAGAEVSGEIRRNIFLILKESIHNIFKHSGASLASIRIQAGRSGFDLWIEDNGKGSDPLSETLGNGLRNMINRAEAMKGTIQFVGENGFKTHFHLPLYHERVIG